MNSPSETLRDELMDIFMEASAMKITPKQYSDKILKAVLNKLPEKPIYPEAMKYVEMVKRASENGKYDDMYVNGWNAYHDAIEQILEGK